MFLLEIIERDTTNGLIVETLRSSTHFHTFRDAMIELARVGLQRARVTNTTFGLCARKDADSNELVLTTVGAQLLLQEF